MTNSLVKRTDFNSGRLDFLFELHAEEKEKTEVLYDVENALSRGVQFMQNVRKCMDLFGDKNGPSSYHILEDLQLYSKCFFILLLMLVLIHHLTIPYMKYQEGYGIVRLQCGSGIIMFQIRQLFLLEDGRKNYWIRC